MTKTWTITVQVPAEAVTADQRDELFTAICDTVLVWEPEQRNGWDATISAGLEGEIR